jgi:hypothetical protein
MTERMIAAAVFLIGTPGLAVIVPRIMATRPKGGGGAIVGLMMVFSSVFDPAQKAAVVQPDRNKQLEGSEEGEGGDGPD